MKIDMINILDFLDQNPDVAGVSKDDLKCKVLLSAVGMLDGFKKAKSPHFSVGVSDSHRTHYIVGILWSGHPLPEQNGYQVLFLPKSQYSALELAEFVDYVMQTNGGHDREIYVRTVPDEWRQHN
jgi:hypothetical protein